MLKMISSAASALFIICCTLLLVRCDGLSNRRLTTHHVNPNCSNTNETRLANLNCSCNLPGQNCRQGTNAFCLNGRCSCTNKTYVDPATGAFCRPFKFTVTAFSNVIGCGGPCDPALVPLIPVPNFTFQNAVKPVTCTQSPAAPPAGPAYLSFTIDPVTGAIAATRTKDPSGIYNYPDQGSSLPYTFSCTDSLGFTDVINLTVTYYRIGHSGESPTLGTPAACLVGYLDQNDLVQCP